MLALNGDPALQAFVLDRLAEQRAAGKLVKGAHWEEGRGGAVGCTLEAVRLRRGGEIDHADCGLYEAELGIPRLVARLEDRVFEGLPEADAQAWPERFIAAIRPGAALGLVWPRFALWLLAEELLPHAEGDPKASAAMADTVALYRQWLDTGDSPEFMRWMRCSSACQGLGDAADAVGADIWALYAAAKAAEAAGHAGQAGVATAPTTAARWAESAGHSAAAAAEYGANAAGTHAYSAGYVVGGSGAAGVAKTAAAAGAYLRQADKLVALLTAA